MEKAMQKYLDKAEVLIEALPYIQRFNRKIIVVKYGGSAMVDEELKARVIQDVTLLKLVGFKPIIVHGGGKEISKWVGKVGMEPQFINGLRVTDAETMELAEMVLGKVNKSLVQLVEQLGVRAIGISGKDGGLLKVDKKLADGEDIGFVGEAYDKEWALKDEGKTEGKREEKIEIAEKIKEAREQGDLSENAEYDAAKDEQRDIEARIEEIEKILKNAEVVVEE